MQEYESSVLFSFVGIPAFLLCVAAGIMGHRQWTRRGFYFKDFERLSEEARQLSKESTEIRSDVYRADTPESSFKTANMETVTTATEWDTGIRIALAAWDDIMQPDEGQPSDIESQKGAKLREKSLGRFIIRLMRNQVLDRRKELSIQLQQMLPKLCRSKWAPSSATNDTDQIEQGRCTGRVISTQSTPGMRMRN
jgi:hypothetical protein